MILVAKKSQFEPCPGPLPRKVRKVIIAGVEFRQYFWDGTGYCLELVSDPAKNSGWCKREYQSMNWGRAHVLNNPTHG